MISESVLKEVLKTARIHPSLSDMGTSRDAVFQRGYARGIRDTLELMSMAKPGQTAVDVMAMMADWSLKEDKYGDNTGSGKADSD